MNINLQKPEIDELVERYRVPGQPGLINYRSFINKLDEVFTENINKDAVIENARSSAVSFNSNQLNCIF